jgi:hypothetical protein
MNSPVERSHPATNVRVPHISLVFREMWDTTAVDQHPSALQGGPIEVRSIPHFAKNERDTPSFLYATLDNAACAPFFKERRMKLAKPTRLHRKSGIWHPNVGRRMRSSKADHGLAVARNENIWPCHGTRSTYRP